MSNRCCCTPHYSRDIDTDRPANIILPGYLLTKLYTVCLQIVGINQTPLKDFQHADVVKIFQSSEEISITVLPSKFHMVIRVNIDVSHSLRYTCTSVIPK